MRILLQDLTTGRYFLRPGEWVPDLEQAQCFRTGDHVIDTARREEIERAAIFYHFNDPKQSFSVRIPQR